jgi:Zn-dependent peptidase ImmA (M78 family)
MDVKRIASAIASKYGTHNPFEIADLRGINVLDCPMKSTLGYYTMYHRIQNIIISCNLPDALRPFVCAHELGHAICHAGLNTQWLKANTLVSTDRIEREASTFAVELLLPDGMVMEMPGIPAHEMAQIAGIPEALIQLKRFNQKPPRCKPAKGR